MRQQPHPAPVSVTPESLLTGGLQSESDDACRKCLLILSAQERKHLRPTRLPVLAHRNHLQRPKTYNSGRKDAVVQMQWRRFKRLRCAALRVPPDAVTVMCAAHETCTRTHMHTDAHTNARTCTHICLRAGQIPRCS